MKNKQTLYLLFGIMAGLVAKLLCLSLFSSHYSTHLFLPFVKTFVDGHWNPWQYVYENKLPYEFPYHALMLYLLSPFVWILQQCKVSSILLTNFVFKFPLLVADFLLFFFLLRLFPHKKRSVVFFYFLNPIILYAIYVHSQLDIIPTALLLAAVYFLTQRKMIVSAVILGLAISTKMHILVVVPLLFFYVFRLFGPKKALLFLGLPFLIVLFFDIPFLQSQGFIQLVLSNPKQSLLFDSYYKIGELKLFLPFISILTVYAHFFNQRKINNDLLFFYLGIVFTVTIFFIYPAPAWYVWLVPFVSIYFVQNSEEPKAILLYGFLSFSYLLFFLFFYQSEYTDILLLQKTVSIKWTHPKGVSLSFTFLEFVILTLMFAFYRHGVKSNSIYKIRHNLMIGIGGDSGAGKSSLLEDIRMLLHEKLLTLEGDGEHKWERGHENWKKFTHLDPKANFIHKQADALLELKQNHSIYRSDYDHDTGQFSDALLVEPKEYIAICGLHPFYLPKLRKIIDFKIFVDTDEKLRKHWKFCRDIAKRGYSEQQIKKQFESREKDSLRYIVPQKNFADVLIRYFSTKEIEEENAKQSISLGLLVTFDASIPIENLLSCLDVAFEWDYNQDLSTQFIQIEEEPSLDFATLSREHIPNLSEIIGFKARWKTGYGGLLQYIFLLLISEKLKGGHLS